MELDGVRARPAKPGRKLIAAYLRVLGNSRSASVSSGFRSLHDRVEPRLRAVVADAFGVDVDVLDPETSLVHDLAADSLDLLDLVVRLEDEFGIAFPEREVGAVATYGDLAGATVALVACRLRAEESAPASAAVEVRIGSGAVPRVVHVVGNAPYDRELLRDALRAARPDETVEVSRVGGAPAESLDRTLIDARFAGTDVRTPGVPGAPAEPSPDVSADDPSDTGRSWPASRLVTASLALMESLGEERDASLRRLAVRRATVGDLAACRTTTNDRVAAFRTVVETYLDVLDDSRTILHAAARELGRLGLVRRAIDERGMNADEVCAAFDSIADALLCYVHALQSQEAWLRTRLPPRAISSRPTDSTDRQELRA
jgi:acyl carrier protein